jgi:excisionase family DNA binding protein
MNHALLLKPNEAATLLAISPRLLWSLTKSGDLPCVRIGRAVRYDPRDLTAWIDRQKSDGGRTTSGCGKHAESP